MEIFTSYFTKMNQLDSSKYTCVSIANSEPTLNFPIMKLREAVPAWSIVSDYKAGKITWDDYTSSYTRDVTLKLQVIFDTLRRIYTEGGNKPIVLLCWEGPSKKCHRHLLANLLNYYHDVEVREL